VNSPAKGEPIVNRITTNKLFSAGCRVALFCTLPLGVWAQHQVEVKQAKVLYVSGNDVVIKTTDGNTRHLVVPSDFRFKVDGKEIGVSDLRTGTVLTQTITTTTEEKMVTNSINVDAKVIEVAPPYLTVGMDDKIKRVKVPTGTTFTIDGKTKTLTELKAGMRVKGTVITSTPTSVVTRSRNVSGQTPAREIIVTPLASGVLLIEEVDVVP
jgi:hypothetical protein